MTQLNAAVILAASLTLAAPATAQDVVEGGELYTDFCAVCHGVGAAGDGPLAEALIVRPPDLTRLMQGGEFPLLQVIGQIDGRNPLLAHGGDMPLFGPWFEGDGADVAMQGPGGQPVLMSRPIADLVAYLMAVQS